VSVWFVVVVCCWAEKELMRPSSPNANVHAIVLLLILVLESTFMLATEDENEKKEE